MAAQASERFGRHKGLPSVRIVLYAELGTYLKGGVSMTELKIFFPLLMVAGAVGSLAVNVIDHGDWATSLQWIGAGILYTALTIRNIG